MPESLATQNDDDATATQLLNGLGDADLLDSWVRDECRDALDMLVRRYAVMVSSVCQRRCRNYADAQDAMQTTFLYLAKSAAKIRQPDRLAGWLHRVAQRASVATIQHQAIEAEQMIDVPAKPEDPLQRLTQRHEAIVLDEELADLPERYRSAIVLHLMEQQTFASVAEQLGTTTGAVRGYIQRGKKLLAKRLRHRGVVPVMAFAAAKAWTCETAAAVQWSNDFLNHLDPATSGDAAPDFSSLESLLHQGNAVMSVSTKTCLIGLAVGAIAVAAIADGVPVRNESTVMTLSSSANGESASVALAQGMMANPRQKGDSAGAIQNVGEMGFAGGGMMMGSDPSKPVAPPLKSIVVQPKNPKSKTAKDLVARLDEPLEINFEGSLDRFTKHLATGIDAEVFVDSRTLLGLNLEPESVTVSVLSGPASNLRSVLRRTLRPHGLKAVIEEDGLVITADWAEQTSRGVSTERWLDVQPGTEIPFEKALESMVSVDYVETPLEQVADELSRQVNIPIQIDMRALDELGLSADTTVTKSLSNVSLRSALNLILSGEDLTYTLNNGVLMFTSADAAAENKRTRAYFLDDVVGSPDVADFSSVMQMVQTTVNPDTWEALGGPSTMFPITGFGRERRSALIVSTTDSVHYQLKLMFDNLRRESVLQPKSRPAAPPSQGQSKPKSGRTPPANAKNPFGSDPFAKPPQAMPDPFGQPSKEHPDDPFG